MLLWFRGQAEWLTNNSREGPVIIFYMYMASSVWGLVLGSGWITKYWYLFGEWVKCSWRPGPIATDMVTGNYTDKTARTASKWLDFNQQEERWPDTGFILPPTWHEIDRHKPVLFKICSVASFLCMTAIWDRCFWEKGNAFWVGVDVICVPRQGSDAHCVIWSWSDCFGTDQCVAYYLIAILLKGVVWNRKSIWAEADVTNH